MGWDGGNIISTGKWHSSLFSVSAPGCENAMQRMACACVYSINDGMSKHV